MSEGFLLRVKYVKHGRLAYLSHLETVRSMERVIRRAQLPYAITEGFNPHMKVAFGPALPVGAGSDGEYLDLRMREYVPAPRALALMRAAAAPNLCPVACEYIDVRSEAIVVHYPISAWEAQFVGECGEDAEQLAARLQQAFAELVAVGHIEVARKRKAPKLVEFAGRLVEPPTVSPLAPPERAGGTEGDPNPLAPPERGSCRAEGATEGAAAGDECLPVAELPRLPLEGGAVGAYAPTEGVIATTIGSRVVVCFKTRDSGEGALRPDKFIAAALAPLAEPPRLVQLTRRALLEE